MCFKSCLELLVVFMDNLSPTLFFHLDQFAHKELLLEMDHVWMGLEQIGPYLKNYPLGKIETVIHPSVHLIDPHLISIGEGTVIEPGTYIKGPCIIGKNCQVRFGAYIRGNVITGDQCVIGHSTEVKNSVFLDHAHAPHFNYVGDSILGNRTNLGAGVKCANLRVDKKNITIHYGMKKFETNLQKIGAILGDDVQIGCNAVLNPGTVIGKKAICFPGIQIGGVIASSSTIKQSI